MFEGKKPTWWFFEFASSHTFPMQASEEDKQAAQLLQATSFGEITLAVLVEIGNLFSMICSSIKNNPKRIKFPIYPVKLTGTSSPILEHVQRIYTTHLCIDNQAENIRLKPEFVVMFNKIIIDELKTVSLREVTMSLNPYPNILLHLNDNAQQSYSDEESARIISLFEASLNSNIKDSNTASMIWNIRLHWGKLPKNSQFQGGESLQA